MEEKSIVLIGFMGVGKTEVGEELARMLQWDSVDTDKQIEQQFSMTTSEIFSKHGEAAFRTAESQIIKALSVKQNQILSLGGGAFLNSDNRDICLENSTVILLELSWEKWLERYPLIKDTRPKLKGLTTEEMYQLYIERKSHYKPYHFKINCDERTVEEVANMVVDGIGVKY